MLFCLSFPPPSPIYLVACEVCSPVCVQNFDIVSLAVGGGDVAPHSFLRQLVNNELLQGVLLLTENEDDLGVGILFRVLSWCRTHLFLTADLRVLSPRSSFAYLCGVCLIFVPFLELLSGDWTCDAD
jgi:hypothetical protein